MIHNQSTHYRRTRDGALPCLGAAAAFRLSRTLRQRLKDSGLSTPGIH